MFPAKAYWWIGKKTLYKSYRIQLSDDFGIRPILDYETAVLVTGCHIHISLIYGHFTEVVCHNAEDGEFDTIHYFKNKGHTDVYIK